MTDREVAREREDGSFAAGIAQHADDTAPVEAVVRTVGHFLRRVPGDELWRLHFLELGCGAASNLVWLARKGITISGVDISPAALGRARAALEDAGCVDRIGTLVEAPVSDVPFLDRSFDGIVEACVFQHLGPGERQRAFSEVSRLLKPDGLFVGYMLDVRHSVYRRWRAAELPDDPGTLDLDLGLCHFYRRAEIAELLAGFSHVDPCLSTFELPRDGARRGDAHRVESMWTVYAVK